MPERYNRVLLKLSGEVFGGGGIGVDADSSSSENLSGQLEKDSVVALWHHLSWSADIDAGCVTPA